MFVLFTSKSKISLFIWVWNSDSYSDSSTNVPVAFLFGNVGSVTAHVILRENWSTTIDGALSITTASIVLYIWRNTIENHAVWIALNCSWLARRPLQFPRLPRAATSVTNYTTWRGIINHILITCCVKVRRNTRFTLNIAPWVWHPM